MAFWIALRSILLAGSSLATALPDQHTKLYSLDQTWQPRFPEGAHTFSAVGVAFMAHGFPWDPPSTSFIFVTQRGNASIGPVLVMNGTDGAFVSSWGKETVGLDSTTKPSAPTWGAHGLSVEPCQYPCGDGEGWKSFFRVYVDDFTNHTLTAYTFDGKQLLQIGTNGVAGTGTSPLQFGNVADTAIEGALVAPSPSPPTPAYLYSSDGDGGNANRVVKVALAAEKTSLEWATKSIYDNPHSIAFHERTNLLIIANREHNETRLLRASDGKDLGAWNCGLKYGKSGRPFGVRTLSYRHTECQEDLDLVIIAIMDNPQDGLNQKLAILDASDLDSKKGAKSKCTILQQLEVPSKYSGPHLLGVDSHNGDIYAALVADAPLSTVLRFRPHGCTHKAETALV